MEVQFCVRNRYWDKEAPNLSTGQGIIEFRLKIIFLLIEFV